MDCWRGALRVKPLGWVTAIRDSGNNSLARAEFLPLRIILWVLLYCFGMYSFIYSTMKQGVIGCYTEILRETFKVYNVMFVMLVFLILGILTNFFCVIRLHIRDIVSLINKTGVLYNKTYKDIGILKQKMRISARLTIIDLFLIPFVESMFYSYDCLRISEARGQTFSEDFIFYFTMLMYYWLLNILLLPVSAVVSVFAITLDSINDCFVALCTHIENLASSKNPKPFLAVSALGKTSHTSRCTLTAESISYLRKCHDELVLHVDRVMEFFQADILVLFLMSFYQITVYSYSIVGSGLNFFRSKENLSFFLVNAVSVTHLMIRLWAACINPSRIQEQVRMFQLQVRNHKAHFEVFGMFQVNISLLFTMCASIVSYIVVLIQFTMDSETSSATPHNNNATFVFGNITNTTYTNSSM